MITLTLHRFKVSIQEQRYTNPDFFEHPFQMMIKIPLIIVRYDHLNQHILLTNLHHSSKKISNPETMFIPTTQFITLEFFTFKSTIILKVHDYNCLYNMV